MNSDTELEKIEYYQVKPAKIPNLPWWNVKRRIYEAWRTFNNLDLASQDQNILIFKDSRKIDITGLIILIGFSIGISLVIPVFLYSIIIFTKIEVLIFAGILLFLNILICYFMWYGTILQLFQLLSNKQLTINRKTAEIVWQLEPWQMKSSIKQFSLYQFALSRAKRQIYHYPKYFTTVYFIKGEINGLIFNFKESKSKQKVEQFYQKLLLFIKNEKIHFES